MSVRALRAFLLLVCLSLPVLAQTGFRAPVFAQGGLRVGEIAGDKVRLRAGPGTKHAILAEMDRGDLVVLEGEEGRWRRVRVPGGFSCYVHGSLVEAKGDGTGTVKGTRVLLRSSPGKEALPLETVLDRLEVVTILGREGEWLKVIPPARAHLFVFDELVRDLGPVAEFRAALARAERTRRDVLLAGRSPEEARLREEARQKVLRDTALASGAKVLSGKGETEELTRKLREVSLQSDDDLTRGYANSLLALLLVRGEMERIRAEVERASEAREDAVGALEKRLVEVESRYAEAIKKARVLEGLRKNPFRGVGVVTKREDGYVLLDRGRVVFHLASRRFRLDDYVGKRVGVNGRMVARDPKTGGTLLMVEKLEIVLVEPGKR